MLAVGKGKVCVLSRFNEGRLAGAGHRVSGVVVAVVFYPCPHRMFFVFRKLSYARYWAPQRIFRFARLSGPERKKSTERHRVSVRGLAE